MSKGAKLLLVAAGFVFMAGIVVVAGLAYVAYRVKGSVERAAQEVRSGSRPSPAAGAVAASAARRIDACALLTVEEASQILGVAIERAQAQAGASQPTCQYFTRPKSQEERTAAVADAFMKMATQPERPLPASENNPAGVARHIGAEDLAKQVGGLTGAADAPYLAFTVNPADGRAGFAVLKGTIAANSAGMKTSEDLAGIGDEAMLGPMDTFLAFVKGPASVQIDLSRVPQARDKGVALARKIAGRM
jgi:hypothetical protein